MFRQCFMFSVSVYLRRSSIICEVCTNVISVVLDI